MLTPTTETKIKQIRRDILNASYEAKACHIGSSMSCVDILVDLFYTKKINPKQFIFAKASGISTYLSILADLNYFPKEKLAEYLRNFPLASKEVPGIVHSTGSISHGFNVAAGLAMSDRGKEIYCLESDGAINEGSFWEAMLFSAHHKLSNLVVIIDRNFLQAMGSTEDIMKLEPLVDKFMAFNWECKRVKGHDSKEIIDALNGWETNKPKILICDTVKGYPISFMSKETSWHYKNLDESFLRQALSELE